MSQYECPYNNNGNKDCSIVRRLAHLCESKFIRRFDDICPVTGQYSLDITEADAAIDEYDARCRDAEAKAENLKNQLKEAKECILELEKKQLADYTLELRTELEQLRAQRRITEMIYKSDTEVVLKDAAAKIQSAADQARNLKKQLKDAKERADNGWERARYLERKVNDIGRLNDQLMRELAWRGCKVVNICESETVSDADAYQKDILKYAPDFDTVAESMAYAAIGLCGEAGETSEIVKKHVYHGHPLDDEHLMRELGDVLWYVTYMAHLLSCPLSTIMALNLDKLAKRYPDGKFDPERSQNRKAGDI